MKNIKVLLHCLLWLLLATLSHPARAFVHPGVVLNTADLNRMKANRNVAPWSTGYAALSSLSQASINYTSEGAASEVGREPNLNRGKYESDCMAVYYQALQWYMTGDRTYADKGMTILNDWSTTHTKWSGGTPFISAGEYGVFMVMGAEILRYTYSGWTAQTTTNCENYFKNVYWPILSAGPSGSLRGANQGMFQLQVASAIAVFCNSNNLLSQVLYSWHYDAPATVNGSLPNGQLGDTGRDQAHALIQIRGLALTAETMYKQGIDLYSELDNRLLNVSEYFCKYNLGNDVPYTPFGCTYDFYLTIGASNRGLLNWGTLPFEILHNAYVVRKKLAASYTRQFLDRIPIDAHTFAFKNTVAPDPASIQPVSGPTPPRIVPPAATTLSSTNIGTIGVAGTSIFNNGTWTIKGGGTSVYTGIDNCYFAYKTLSGNGTIIARVTGIQNALSNKTGLMIRESLDADAPNRVALMALANNSVECTFPTNNLVRKSEIQPMISTPWWLKLERNGNRINAYQCGDGVNWSCVVSVPVSMGSTVYAGLAVCSNSNTQLNTSTFDNVGISGTGGSLQNGIYKLTVRHSGYAMSVADDDRTGLPGTGNGALIQQSPFAGGLHQLWNFDDMGDGKYRIIGVGSGKALDVAGISLDDGAPMQIYAPGGGNNQRFTFTPTSGGFGRLTPVHSGKAVEVSSNLSSGGAPVQQWTYNGGTNQQWWPQTP